MMSPSLSGLVDRHGRPDSPVCVIVLHGAVVNRAAMRGLAQLLAPDAHVLVPDLPGHGSLRDRAFTWDGALAVIDELLAAVTAPRIIVAGDSLGGYLALGVAARHGERIAGVVAGGCTFALHGAYALGAMATDLPVTLSTRIVGERVVEQLLLRAFERLGGDAATSAAIAAAGMRLAARAESIAALRAVRLGPLVRGTTAPIVLVNGARDVPIVWFAPRYARLAADARVVRIPGCGHGVMTLAPTAVAAIMRPLLDAQPA